MAAERRNFWTIIATVWLAATLVLAAMQALTPGDRPLLADTDDAMRMVTATDLLDGQPWQDTNQYRDNAPYGTSMHWSRLVDAPLAVLIALERIIGMSDLAAILGPLLLLAPLLALSALWAERIAGPGQMLAALALPLLSLPILAEFSPGRVDHHNVQIVLTGGLALALADSTNHRNAPVVAGILAAASLAIGMETLPFVVLAIALVCLNWAFDPLRWRRPMAGFALALALANTGLFLLAVPPSAYLARVCDSISLTYVTATALAAAVMLIAARFGLENLKTLSSRLLLLVILGAAALGAVLMLFPECARGPYSLVDPRMMALMDAMAETRPLWVVLRDQPGLAVAMVLPPLAAMLVMVARLRATSGAEQLAWIVLLSFLALALLMTIVQFRSARFTAALAVPAGVWLVAETRRRYLAGTGPARAAGLVAAWLAFAGIAQFPAVNLLATLAPAPALAAPPRPGLFVAREKCFTAGNFAELAALPPGIVLAPPTLGPHILHYTPHSVVSAAFHRNTEGTLDALTFYEDDEQRARAIVAQRNVDYVVGCPAIPAIRTWSWLKPMSPPQAPLEILAIVGAAP